MQYTFTFIQSRAVHCRVFSAPNVFVLYMGSFLSFQNIKTIDISDYYVGAFSFYM